MIQIPWCFGLAWSWVIHIKWWQWTSYNLFFNDDAAHFKPMMRRHRPRWLGGSRRVAENMALQSIWPGYHLFYHFFLGWTKLYQIITAVSVDISSVFRGFAATLFAAVSHGEPWQCKRVGRSFNNQTNQRMEQAQTVRHFATSCDLVRPLTSAQDHVQLRNALRALGLILDAKFHSIFGQDKAGGCATVDGGVMVETCGNMMTMMKHVESDAIMQLPLNRWPVARIRQDWQWSYHVISSDARTTLSGSMSHCTDVSTMSSPPSQPWFGILTALGLWGKRPSSDDRT